MTSNARTSSRHPYSEDIRLETMTEGIKEAEIERYCAHCLNISQGGLGFSTGRELREREVVKLSFPLKDFDISLPVLAEVLWVKPAERRYRVGVRYLV
jgi:Tfp pilus assembly protein PilZ